MRHTSWIGKWKKREDFSRAKNNNNIWLYVFASVLLSVVSPRQWNKHMYPAITTVSCHFIARGTNANEKKTVPPRILARNVDNAESGCAVRVLQMYAATSSWGNSKRETRIIIRSTLPCEQSRTRAEGKTKHQTTISLFSSSHIFATRQKWLQHPTDNKREKATKNTIKKCVSAERMYMQREEKKEGETEKPWPKFGRRWNKICTLYNDIHKTRRESEDEHEWGLCLLCALHLHRRHIWMGSNVKTDVTSHIHYIFSPNFVLKYGIKFENIDFVVVVVFFTCRLILVRIMHMANRSSRTRTV